MFDDINLPSNSLLHEGLLQPFTQIDYGGNHLRIAVDPSSYEEIKTKIGQSVIDLPQLRRQLLNKVDMKWMYNSQIQVFSRGNLASLAILRHLLTFLCRTEAGVENFNFSYN